jgi:hypothetical protein
MMMARSVNSATFAVLGTNGSCGITASADGDWFAMAASVY